MNTWLIFLKSKEQYQKIQRFLKFKGNKIYSPFFYVINGPLKCKNGQIIGKKEEFLLAFTFVTYEEAPMDRIMSTKIALPNDIIRLDALDDSEINFEDDMEADCYIKKGKNFFNEKTLSSYLERIEFKFKP